jgi:hypothetical protein
MIYIFDCIFEYTNEQESAAATWFSKDISLESKDRTKAMLGFASLSSQLKSSIVFSLDCAFSRMIVGSFLVSFFGVDVLFELISCADWFGVVNGMVGLLVLLCDFG